MYKVLCKEFLSKIKSQPATSSRPGAQKELEQPIQGWNKMAEEYMFEFILGSDSAHYRLSAE